MTRYYRRWLDTASVEMPDADSAWGRVDVVLAGMGFYPCRWFWYAVARVVGYLHPRGCRVYYLVGKSE